MNKKEVFNSILAVALGLIAGAILMFAIGDNAVIGPNAMVSNNVEGGEEVC